MGNPVLVKHLGGGREPRVGMSEWTVSGRTRPRSRGSPHNAVGRPEEDMWIMKDERAFIYPLIYSLINLTTPALHLDIRHV